MLYINRKFLRYEFFSPPGDVTGRDDYSLGVIPMEYKSKGIDFFRMDLKSIFEVFRLCRLSNIPKNFTNRWCTAAQDRNEPPKKLNSNCHRLYRPDQAVQSYISLKAQTSRIVFVSRLNNKFFLIWYLHQCSANLSAAFPVSQCR